MNPLLPKRYYIPDVEARQWKDGRIYLYGSNDICANTDYCSSEYQVFSSLDMKTWINHGQSFSVDNIISIRRDSNVLYAPDCIFYNGKYYLFFCLSDNTEGIAESFSPYGPFENARVIEGANGDAIDPSAFVDDDNKIYYFWGQNNVRGGRLKPDLSGFEPGSINKSILTEKIDGFHEGISIRKRNGIYYLVYTDISRGKATCLGYATSTSPLGPYKKGGIIIDNTGCDPNTWNNHGSIEKVNGNWYIFYHRSTHNSNFSRRVCVEPITFNEDGSINEVEMTSQGIEDPIDCQKRLEAANACLLSGKVYVNSHSDGTTFFEYLSHIEDKDWVAYKYLSFNKRIENIVVEASSFSYGGIIDVYLDGLDGKRIATINVNNTGGWTSFKKFKANVLTDISGKHSVYMVFKGNNGRLLNLLSIQFI